MNALSGDISHIFHNPHQNKNKLLFLSHFCTIQMINTKSAEIRRRPHRTAAKNNKKQISRAVQQLEREKRSRKRFAEVLENVWIIENLKTRDNSNSLLSKHTKLRVWAENCFRFFPSSSLPRRQSCTLREKNELWSMSQVFNLSKLLRGVWASPRRRRRRHRQESDKK